MKSTGIVRHVDDLGRVVIPKELRRTFGINEGDSLEVFTDGDKIVLRKYAPGCTLCGSVNNDLKTFAGKLVCTNCLDTIADKHQKGGL